MFCVPHVLADVPCPVTAISQVLTDIAYTQHPHMTAVCCAGRHFLASGRQLWIYKTLFVLHIIGAMLQTPVHMLCAVLAGRSLPKPAISKSQGAPPCSAAQQCHAADVHVFVVCCSLFQNMSLPLTTSFKLPETLSCPAAHQCHAADPGEADSRCSEAVHLPYQEPAPQC